MVEDFLSDFFAGNYESLIDNSNFRESGLLEILEAKPIGKKEREILFNDEKLDLQFGKKEFHFDIDGVGVRIVFTKDSIVILDKQLVDILFSEKETKEIASAFLVKKDYQFYMKWIALGICRYEVSKFLLYHPQYYSTEDCLVENGKKSEVIQYYDALIEEDNILALHGLVNLLEDRDIFAGKPGSRNPRVISLLEKGAEKGDLRAISLLAIKYEELEEYDTAYIWWEKEYEIDKKDAIFAIIDLINGKKIELDKEKTEEYYQFLFDTAKEDKRMAWRLAKSYELGLNSFSEDRDEALKWYIVARNLGDSRVQDRLDRWEY